MQAKLPHWYTETRVFTTLVYPKKQREKGTFQLIYQYIYRGANGVESPFSSSTGWTRLKNVSMSFEPKIFRVQNITDSAFCMLKCKLKSNILFFATIYHYILAPKKTQCKIIILVLKASLPLKFSIRGQLTQLPKFYSPNWA